MRKAACIVFALSSSPAFAGGLGLLGTAGAHTETVYFYSDHDVDGNEFNDIDDYDQYQLVQTLPNFGTGLELLLGDRDDKIFGVCRLYWMLDAPQVDPATVTQQVDPEFVIAAYRDSARHLGMGMIGLSWGVIGNPDNFMVNATGHVGSAFITADHTEFLALDIGPGVSYRVNRQVQLFGDVAYQARFRKTWGQSVNVFAGARYMFD